MFRVISCALCACASLAGLPAAAAIITISEGHHERVDVFAGNELHMTGGTVGFLNVIGGTAILEGGTLLGGWSQEVPTPRVGRGGTVIIRGTDRKVSQTLRTHIRESGDHATVIFEGLHFRTYHQPASASKGFVSIEGVLSDRSFLKMTLSYEGPHAANYIEFRTTDERYDADGDWDFDIHDLNLVRNNFGLAASVADGDIDGDGWVGIGDLNIVRNQFGHQFFMSPSAEFSGLLFPEAAAVPEPSSLLLFASFACFAGLPALKTARSRNACR